MFFEVLNPTYHNRVAHLPRIASYDPLLVPGGVLVRRHITSANSPSSSQARSRAFSFSSRFFRNAVITRWTLSISLTGIPAEMLLTHGACTRNAALYDSFPLSVRVISCARR